MLGRAPLHQLKRVVCKPVTPKLSSDDLEQPLSATPVASLERTVADVFEEPFRKSGSSGYP